jgi:hypothetical protein
MIRRTVVPAALMLLLVAGCAQSQSDTGSAGSVPSSSAGASPSGLPSELPPGRPSGLPESAKPGRPAAGPTTTLTGTIAAGIEPNCLLLQEAGGTHLLVFDDATLRASATVGSKVRVTGAPQPGMMTTCQQGEPFLVTSVTPG